MMKNNLGLDHNEFCMDNFGSYPDGSHSFKIVCSEDLAKYIADFDFIIEVENLDTCYRMWISKLYSANEVWDELRRRIALKVKYAPQIEMLNDMRLPRQADMPFIYKAPPKPAPKKKSLWARIFNCIFANG